MGLSVFGEMDSFSGSYFLGVMGHSMGSNFTMAVIISMSILLATLVQISDVVSYFRVSMVFVDSRISQG